MAALIGFSLRINVAPGRPKSIRPASRLLAGYPAVFTPRVVRKIGKFDPHVVFLSGRDGHGRRWRGCTGTTPNAPITASPCAPLRMLADQLGNECRMYWPNTGVDAMRAGHDNARAEGRVASTGTVLHFT